MYGYFTKKDELVLIGDFAPVYNVLVVDNKEYTLKEVEDYMSQFKLGFSEINRKYKTTVNTSMADEKTFSHKYKHLNK